MAITLELVNKLLFRYESDPFFSVRDFHAALEKELDKDEQKG